MENTYSKMQKLFYDNENMSPEDIVGSYKWHENFPYESQLLFKRGDMRFPLFEDTKDKVALDFGCGPGRMVSRMSSLFKRVDGVDISQRLLDEAKKLCPNGNFFLSSGTNLGIAKNNEYDFVFSTIAMQHIAVRSIRLRILESIRKALKEGGKISIQMAFNTDFPFVINKGSFNLGKYKLRILKKYTQNAYWEEDKVDAKSTNGNCDVGIGYEDIPKVISDFEMFFDDVSFWFYDVRLLYNDLDGEKHGNGHNYWPTHWVFISGTKKQPGNNLTKRSHLLNNVWNKKNAEYNLLDQNSLTFKFLQTLKKVVGKSKLLQPLKVYVKRSFPDLFS